MRVRFFADIRNITGCVEADIPYRETAGALARSLCDLYGEALKQKIYPAEQMENGKKRTSTEINEEEKFGPEIIFLINGRHVNHLGGTAAPLNPDDRVDVFPMLAGG